MTVHNENGGIVGETAKAVAELAKSVPIYNDAIQPAAKEVGKSLHLVSRAVNAALMPVEGLVWGIERIRDFVRERVAAKLENVPMEDVQQPKPHIAVPAIEALRYTGSDSELSELYANLLATSMDRMTAYRAHPGFVDIIKNMAPDEARIMSYLAAHNGLPLVEIRMVKNADESFITTNRNVSLIGFKAGCEHPALCPNYLDNLQRLGLITILDIHLVRNELYEEIKNHSSTKEIAAGLPVDEKWRVEFEKQKLNVTDFGKQFIQACVLDKTTQKRS